MIVSFRHKGLRQFYRTGDRSRLRQDQVRRIAVVLAALDEAAEPRDLDRPSLRLHPMKGELDGFWSVWINGNWRIVFRFENAQVCDVDLLDYH